MPPNDRPLAPMDVEARLLLMRRALAETACDAALVTHLPNIRYLTGFTGSAAMLLVTADGTFFVTDGRYGQQSEEQLSEAGVKAEIVVGPPADQKKALIATVEAARAAGQLRRLGLEAAHVSWQRQQELGGWFADVELVATSELVERQRSCKDAGEVDRIGEACRIADSALTEVIGRLHDGPTEREFGLELDFAMRRLGAADVSFETIVAAGPNGARPHHRPSHRPIGRGDLVTLDFGALVDGYHSDMTRTVAVGEPADPTLRRAVEIVARAQGAGVEGVRPGVKAKEVDSICRRLIAEAGWGERFVHGTGHGVGLDIHEWPLVGQTSTATLIEGAVITVEPGVYLPGTGGVRIEDTVVVTPDGCRPLTHFPKDLVI